MGLRRGEKKSGSQPAGTRESGEQGPEPKPEPTTRIGRIRAWFTALFRAAVALAVTLAVLGALAGITDVVLHITRHTSTNSTTYSEIDAVHVILDGDVSLTVVGRSSGQTTAPGQSAAPGQSGLVVPAAYSAVISAVDTSTPFDDPSRTATVVDGTLDLTETCPDSRCSVQLNLTVDPNVAVAVVAGNALRLDDAMIEFDDLAKPATVTADPGMVVVRNAVVSGSVIGTVDCDSAANCQAVQNVSDGTVSAPASPSDSPVQSPPPSVSVPSSPPAASGSATAGSSSPSGPPPASSPASKRASAP